MTRASTMAVLLVALPVIRADAGDHYVFAYVDGHELRLELSVPESVVDPPLAVWVHGGGWQEGSYTPNPLVRLTEYGFAVASISYRFSDKAVFPAQIHDCKGAIRWLRAHAKEHGYDASRIGVVGASAGGHLALMLGVTGGVERLEGMVGGNLSHSSKVQAVVDLFGASDFLLRSRRQPAKTEVSDGSVFKLLGGAVSEKAELARLASPVFHVTRDDAPLQIWHGDSDKVVFLEQSRRMAKTYAESNLDATLIVVPDGGHGDKAFLAGYDKAKVRSFLSRHLKENRDAPPGTD